MKIFFSEKVLSVITGFNWKTLKLIEVLTDVSRISLQPLFHYFAKSALNAIRLIRFSVKSVSLQSTDEQSIQSSSLRACAEELDDQAFLYLIKPATKCILMHALVKKWVGLGLFFIYFCLFQTNTSILTTNIYEKMLWPSSIWCQDSNPRPSERKSTPITTRPGLVIGS